MRQLVKDAQPEDRLVFHCTPFAPGFAYAPPELTPPVPVSGHGSQVLAPPEHVEETDGWDEGKRVFAPTVPPHLTSRVQ